MTHELIITFEPRQDDEAERILSAVEALGFQIADAVEIKSTLAREEDRSQRVTPRGEYRVGGVPQATCTFCGKDEQEVDRLVAGPVTYICDGCVDLCVEIVGRSDDH